MKAKCTCTFAWGRMFACVCLIIFQSFCIGSAQPRFSRQEIEALFQAIDDNDTNALQVLYSKNTNVVNDLYRSGYFPLLQAAADGRTEIVTLLLKYGADPNAEGDTRMSAGARMTALEAAVNSGHQVICQILLKAGANPNHLGPLFGTPLHCAFNNGHAELAGLLLDYGANPFVETGYYRRTPVELAISHGDGKLVPRMLDQSRANTAASKAGIKSSQADRRNQSNQTISEFIKNHGVGQLSAAAQRGEIEAVQALLKAGVSAKEDSGSGQPMLQAFALAEASAARGNNFASNRWLQVRDLLIKNGADYDAFAATALGDIEQARCLSSANGNVALNRDRDGQTPLHWAVQNDQLPMTSFWLQAGASPAATNSAGQSALHLAATKGLVNHLKILLAAQAPTDMRDTNGWTPLDAAIQAKQTETIRLLLKDRPAETRPERAVAISLHDAAASGNITALAVLTETTNHLEARNELGLTPLQVAVQHGHLAAAALLVDKGADVNARDPDGNTLLLQTIPRYFNFYVSDRPPTNWFKRMGQDPRKEIYLKYLAVGQYEQGPHAILQTVSFLLVCGSDANATNRAGQTAIQLATDEKTTSFDDREPLLKLLSAGGGKVDERDAKGNTALHRAATGYGDSLGEKVPALIASGADVNATNLQGRTPLHIAVEKITSWPSNPGGPDSAVQSLIAAKANVNAQDIDGLTPLHILATADNSFRAKATSALLAAGAKPDLRDKHGRTPAHLFLSGKWAWSEAAECVGLLVKAGADLSSKDGEGKTPLHCLAALGSQSPMFFIRGIGDIFVTAKVDFQARDNEGNTPLHIAVKSGTKDVFDWLVKQGAGLDETNNIGETPRLLGMHSTNRFSRFNSSADTDVFQAVREGKMESLAAMLKADATLVNKPLRSGQTPLRLAVTLRRTNVVELLEQKGAQWDAVSATMFGRREELRKILGQQPAAISNTASGSCPLHFAAANGDMDTIKLLLGAGADLRVQDSRGLTPLGVALLKNQVATVNLLRQCGAAENFFDATYIGDLQTASAIIAKDKSIINATDSSGETVVEIAAATGQAKILKLLLDRGGAVNSTNSQDGRSPLHAAVLYGQTNAVDLLLRHKANTEAYDRYGMTPLHRAIFQGSSETTALLLKHKASPDAPMIRPGGGPLPSMRMPPGLILLSPGNSPLHLAAFFAQTNLIQLLLKSGASVNLTNAYGRTPLDLANYPEARMEMFRFHQRAPGPLDVYEVTAPQSFNPFPSQPDAARMLEQAGGKRSQAPQPFGRF